MEQLSPEVRQKVVKMSEARLRQKLVQAGYREVDISTFDQATLLEYYAKVLLAETAYVPAKEEQDDDQDCGGDSEEDAEFAESKAGVQHTAGGHMSVEERRLAMEERMIMLEERRLEEQRLQREEQRRQRELEEKRCEQQLEQQRMQLRNRDCSEKNKECSVNWREKMERGESL